MKKFLRVLSLILVLTLFIQILPMNAIAEEVNTFENDASASAADNPITGECVELRDKYTKVFERKDRSKIAVVSPEAIHYKKDGKFVDIDNTMVESGKLGDKVLTNTNNPLGVELPKTLNEDKEIKVSNEGYTLSFKFIEDLDSASAHVQKYKEAKADKEREDINSQAYEKAGLNKKSSEVAYSEIMDNVDVEYVVQAEKLKENIIIKEKPTEDAVFSYSINAPKLTATVNKDNSINFYSAKDKKDVVFYLPAPVMFDSNGASSGDIKVELNKAAGGTYTMTYKPSMAWLNGSEIQYPITLDPVISSEKTTDTIDDTYVSSASASTNYGTGIELFAQYNTKVPLIKLNSLSIPNDAVITKANLNLYNIVNGTGTCTLNAKWLYNSWTESGLTWTQFNGFTLGKVQDSINADIGIAAYINWDITNVIKDWYTRGYLGYGSGILIETTGSTSQDVKFASSENTDSLKRPYYTIEYRSVSGISYGNDNHTQSLGRAGTGYVNDFSGALTIERTDMSFGGNRMPAEIKWYYNSNERDNNIGYGYGIRNLYTESLQYVPSSTTVPTAYYALKLGDGGTRYLDVLPSSSDANAPNVQDEQSGEKYTIRQLTVSGCTAYSLTDGEQTTKYFRRNDTYTTTSKFLYKIEEVEGERITRVPATADVGGHFTVRQEDGSEKDLFIITYNGDNSISLKDKETNMMYRLYQTTVNGNTVYRLEDNDGKIKRYAGTDTNIYTTKFLYQTEAGGTTTNVIINNIQINVDFTTANGTINSITDGAGRQYVFNYTNDILTSVEFNGTGTTSISDVNYTYDSSNRLNYVIFPDDQSVYYIFLSPCGCLINNVDERYYYYECSDNGQVESIQENATDGSDGNYITIDYSANQTIFTDNSGNKQVENFDQYGNTIASRDKDGNAYFGEYGENSGKGQNLLLGKSNPRRPTENIFENGGFEITSENAPISIPSPNSGVTVTPFYEGTDDNPAYAGKNCFKASYPGHTNIKQDITKTVNGLGIGKFYTFSFWLRTIGLDTGIIVSCSDGAGHSDKSKQTIIDGKWQYVQVTSMTANGQANITISWDCGGSLYIDNMQLEQANPANSYNFVENSDFSDGENHWADSANATGNQTTTFAGDATGTPAKLDNNRRKLVGALDGKITSYQRIPVDGKAGETYSFGGWACAEAALPVSDTNGRS